MAERHMHFGFRLGEEELLLVLSGDGGDPIWPLASAAISHSQHMLQLLREAGEDLDPDSPVARDIAEMLKDIDDSAARKRR